MQRPIIVYLLLVIWLTLFTYSFFSTAGVEPTGDGFVRGMNRVVVFFKWHGSAFAFALASLIIGWRAETKARRWLSKGPMIVHVLSVVGLLGTSIVLYQKEKALHMEAAETAKPAVIR